MIRRAASFLLPLLALLTVATALPAAAETPAAERGGRETYIVLLRDGADPHEVARRTNADVRTVYTDVVRGFATTINGGQARALRNDDDVLAVEKDIPVTADAVQATSTADLWNLDRLDQRALPLSNRYNYRSYGQRVNVYVVDTGIAAHREFGSRARNVYDAFGGNGADCNGHGTHVAGTIGGATTGVAKGVMLYGLRVLDCAGGGSSTTVLGGLESIARGFKAPAVVNMSLGGVGTSQALDAAVANLTAKGIFVAVAAGNSNVDACTSSPARVPTAYVVAASDRGDRRASFSNYGGCVDGYAPGVAIRSAATGGGYSLMSGTSMAAPAVAGLAALYKSTYGDASPAALSSWINSRATANVVRSNPAGTVNRLVFTAGL